MGERTTAFACATRLPGRRQHIVHRDHAAARERDGLLGHVLELADVAGEIVLCDRLDDALGEPSFAAHLAVVLLQEEAHEDRDVLPPLAQRRKYEARDVQTVVEILAETL